MGSHVGHIEGHIHVNCEDSAQATRYSACSCCNGFLDQVKMKVAELQESAREAGLCPGCGSDWCSGGCDDEGW
jgi:uncharacterized protein with PIN domain